MKTFVSPEAISPDLVKKIRNLHRKMVTLPEIMGTFSGKGKGSSFSHFPLVVLLSSMHLHLSSPSKLTSTCLPSLKPFLSGPILPRRNCSLKHFLLSPMTGTRTESPGK